MKWIIATMLISLATIARASTPIKVAVIDTGMPKVTSLPYCKEGHKDFTGTGLYDTHGHGTNVASLITREAKGANFCLVSVKYYSATSDNLENMKKAIQYAIDIGVDVINVSGGGTEYNREEALIIQRALNKGIKVLVAAGNEGQDFSKGCNYFPACYDDRIIAVGCMSDDYTPCIKSNFGGKIKHVAIGNAQAGSEGWPMTGTSQATAVATGTYVKAIELTKAKK